MKVTKRIQLDLERHTNRPAVFAVQGDTETRFLEIMLLKSGFPYTIPDGVTARFNCKRANGEKIATDDLSTENSIITLELTAHILAVPGTAECTVSLLDGTEEIERTQPFRLKVQYSPRAEQSF